MSFEPFMVTSEEYFERKFADEAKLELEAKVKELERYVEVLEDIIDEMHERDRE